MPQPVPILRVPATDSRVCTGWHGFPLALPVSRWIWPTIALGCQRTTGESGLKNSVQRRERSDNQMFYAGDLNWPREQERESSSKGWEVEKLWCSETAEWPWFQEELKPPANCSGEGEELWGTEIIHGINKEKAFWESDESCAQPLSQTLPYTQINKGTIFCKPLWEFTDSLRPMTGPWRVHRSQFESVRVEGKEVSGWLREERQVYEEEDV